MKSENLEDFVGKEVFIVADNSDAYFIAHEVFVFENAADLQEHLLTLESNIDSDKTVLHGYLTSAEQLPSNLNNRAAFILVVETGTRAIMIESSGNDCDDLAEEIQDILVIGPGNRIPPEIDEVFVLYGYEVELKLCIDEESLDEEVLDSCRKIAEEVST